MRALPGPRVAAPALLGRPSLGATDRGAGRYAERMEPSESEAAPDPAGTPAPVSLLTRLLALIALLALLASGAVTSWWILTDQADFGGASPSQAADPSEARPRFARPAAA